MFASNVRVCNKRKWLRSTVWKTHFLRMLFLCSAPFCGFYDRVMDYLISYVYWFSISSKYLISRLKLICNTTQSSGRPTTMYRMITESGCTCKKLKLWHFSNYNLYCLQITARFIQTSCELMNLRAGVTRARGRLEYEFQ